MKRGQNIDCPRFASHSKSHIAFFLSLSRGRWRARLTAPAVPARALLDHGHELGALRRISLPSTPWPPSERRTRFPQPTRRQNLCTPNDVNVALTSATSMFSRSLN